MRTIATLFAVGLAFAQSQAVQKSFRVANPATPNEFEEVALAARVMSDISQSADPAARTIVATGTPGQLAIAEWVLNELDRPQTQQGVLPRPEFTVAADDLVRIFALPGAPTVQDFQEIATLVRTTLEVRRVRTVSSPRAVVMRGTRDQMKASEWLFAELNAPPREARRSPVYNLGADDVLQVFYLRATETIQDFQEAATMGRTVGNILRMFTYNRPRAVAIRGTAEQLKFSAWLFDALLTEPRGPAVFRFAGVDDSASLLRAPRGLPRESLQQVAKTLRESKGASRVFPHNQQRAIALRGTTAQLDKAGRLLAELVQ